MTDKKIKQIGNIVNTGNFKNPQRGRIYDPGGISPTLNTCGGGGLEVKIVDKKTKCLNSKVNGKQPSLQDRIYASSGIAPACVTGFRPFIAVEQELEGGEILVREATKQGYAVAKAGDSININYPNSKSRRGRVGKGVAHTLTTQCEQAVVLPCIAASRGRNPDNPGDRTPGVKLQQRLEVNEKGMSNTLTTVTKDNYVIEEDLAIRKLTPREYGRLQDFSDETFDRLEGISDSQLYKIFGNSITVAVPREAFILQALICLPGFTTDHSCVNCENCVHAGGNKFYCDIKFKLIAERGRHTDGYEEDCEDWELKRKIQEVLDTAISRTEEE